MDKVHTDYSLRHHHLLPRSQDSFAGGNTQGVSMDDGEDWGTCYTVFGVDRHTAIGVGERRLKITREQRDRVLRKKGPI